jgi:hypothetical protein
MIFQIKIDASYQFDQVRKEYVTIEERIVHLLKHLQNQGFFIYEYVLQKNPCSDYVASLMLKSILPRRKRLFVYNKSVDDYLYEVSSVNTLILTKEPINSIITGRDHSVSYDSMVNELLDLFSIHIEIVESASISVSSKRQAVIAELSNLLLK